MSFDVLPCTEAVRMTMRPIVKFKWLLDAIPLMCRLQCCGFCSLLDWYDGEQHHFLLSLVGHVCGNGIRRDLACLFPVISTISLIHTMVTVVAGLHLLVISQLIGKRV